MTWLLLVIQLGGDPVSGVPIITSGEVAETFASKQACVAKIKQIEEIDKHEHPTIRLGCVIYPKKAI